MIFFNKEKNGNQRKITLCGLTFTYTKKEKIAFTGDTLFKGSVGRTDLFGGNHAQLMESIKKIKRFAPDTALLCGHGESTTVAREMMYNFYLL